ncbi:MAG: alpha/beta hydrolase [Planctomycetaceae bacterium]
MNSRLHKYDLSSLSSFGGEAPLSVQVPELRELLMAEQGMQQDFDNSGPAFSDWPVAIHVPESYEPGYAYPLVIWLHADGGNEADLDHVMPAISDRNYIGISFRANCRMSAWPVEKYRWSMTMDESRFFEEVLYCTVVQLRRAYHIHSERIAIGGSGSGATLALQTLLRRPEWFNGAVMLGGRMPGLEQPLLNIKQLRDKRVLQIADTSDPRLDVDEFKKLRRLLYSAGMEVEMSVSETNVPCEETLRCVDYWMMDAMMRSALA